MNKPFNRPTEIIKLDIDTERYKPWPEANKILHARVNTNYKRGTEKVEAGAVQAKRSLIFEYRYSKTLADIEYELELYSIVYKGQTFNIVAYDDYMEEHQVIRLYGDQV